MAEAYQSHVSWTAPWTPACKSFVWNIKKRNQDHWHICEWPTERIGFRNKFWLSSKKSSVQGFHLLALAPMDIALKWFWFKVRKINNKNRVCFKNQTCLFLQLGLPEQTKERLCRFHQCHLCYPGETKELDCVCLILGRSRVETQQQPTERTQSVKN